MGKRSRKRGVPERAVEVSPSGTTRAERDAARRRRAQALAQAESSGRQPRRRPGKTSFEDRPPAPWGSFPLVELCVLAGIILLVAGFLVRGQRGPVMVVCGLALGSLAGLELSIREHFSGFRSHTTLLAGAVACAALAATFFLTKGSSVRVIVPIVGGVVFLIAFWLFRQAFAKRAGGVGFRR